MTALFQEKPFSSRYTWGIKDEKHSLDFFNSANISHDTSSWVDL